MAATTLQTRAIVHNIHKADSPVRIDWATCRSESQHTSDEIGPIQKYIFKTPPSKTVNHSKSNTKEAWSVINESIESTDRRVYSIPSLLERRGSLAGIGVFAKIKPEALAENLFQYIGAHRPLQVAHRSRGLSEISNPSRGSISSYNPSYPIFQPKVTGLHYGHSPAPPENSTIQQNEGFARFLKQHASPPHHRVTAGGRIVPTGPLSPPPMFDYTSLTGMIRPRSGKPREPFVRGLTSASNGVIQEAVEQDKPMIGYHNAVLSLNGLPVKPSHTPSQEGGFLISGDPGQRQSMPLIPMGTFEDGTTIASYNGLFYRTYWNGAGTVMEPLYNSLAQVSTGTQTESSKKPSFQMRHPSESPSLQGREQRNPLANATNKPRVSSSRSQLSFQLRDMNSQHLELSRTLRDLDKHLALHHYGLSQEERAALVTQRKTLVKEIDNIRRITDPSSQDLPVVGLKDFAKGRSSLSTSYSKANHTDSEGKNPALKVPQDRKSKKALSPAAPPFIPGCIALPSLEIKDPKNVPTPLNPMMQSLTDSTSLERPMYHANASNDNGLGNLHAQDESLDRDSIDPAMRTVHNSDIKYATKFKQDLSEGQKQYCTLASEFQEALRQVRQQARLYGCAGGSSKDPAYDAEQDIWWAICDEDPIPLPPQTPDYVSNPRPWNWSDSIFNYRRITAPLTRNEPYQNAQNSTNTSVRFHALQGTSSDMPLQNNLRASGADEFSEKTDSIQEVFANTVTPNLDQEYLAVQKAIDALNKRSKAIVAQAKNLSSIGLNEPGQSEAKLSGTHRGSQILLSGKDISSSKGSHNVPQPEQEIRKASVMTHGSSNHDDFGLTGSTQSSLDSMRGSATKLKALVPRRELNASKNGRVFPLYAQRASNSKLQLEKSRVSAVSKDPKSDLTNLKVSAKSSLQGSQSRGQLELFARTKEQFSPRKAAKKAMEFYERSKFKIPQKNLRQNSLTSTPIAPRVNLPTLTNAQLESKSDSIEASKNIYAPPSMPTSFHSNEVKVVAVTGATKDTFLRDMLKGPRYSSAHPPPKKLEYKTGTNSKKRTNLKDKTPVMEANKENAADKRSSATVLHDSLSSHNRLPYTDRYKALAGKAASSLAASAYHANGYLPQYDGAGRAQTSNVHQQHGVPVAHRQAKVNLPQCSSYGNRESSQNASSSSTSLNSRPTCNKGADLSSMSFGLDGSGDATSKSEDSSSALDTNSGKWKRKQKVFDTMGVTKADFDQQRADPHNAEHHSKVTDLFNEIAEEEATYIATRKRQNTKTG